AVVGDVVAEVGHRRWEDGRDPDGIDAQPLQVVQPLGDARQVAYAVVIGVLKPARVDLVDDAALPPLGLIHSLSVRPLRGAPAAWLTGAPPAARSCPGPQYRVRACGLAPPTDTAPLGSRPRQRRRQRSRSAAPGAEMPPPCGDPRQRSHTPRPRPR